MGIKTISVAGIHLGVWSFDCPSLMSKVFPGKKKPFFMVEVEAGGAIGAAVEGVLGLFGDAAKSVGDGIAGAAPGFYGKIQIELEAIRAIVFCDEEVEDQQAVGWDYLFTVTIVGSIDTGAASVKVTLVLPISAEGEREWCDCNEDINIEDLLMSMLPDSADHEAPASIETHGTKYGFQADSSHIKALAMTSVESESAQSESYQPEESLGIDQPLKSKKSSKKKK